MKSSEVDSPKANLTEAVVNSKNWVAISATAAIAVVSVSSIVYYYFKSRADQKKAEKLYRKRLPLKAAAEQTEEDLLTPSFLRRQQLRSVRLYFDQNDEVVDEETAMRDPNNFYHKYHAVEVDYSRLANGEDEDEDLLEEIIGQNGGKARQIEKITKDTFYGEKPADNAQIFVNKLQKTRTKHLKKVQDRELFLAGGSHLNDTSNAETEGDENNSDHSNIQPVKNKEHSSVILDLNPEKYEKPKDYLFFDFFSLYAKNFIGEKKATKKQSQFKYNP